MSTERERLATALKETRNWYTQNELAHTLKVSRGNSSTFLRQLIAEGVAQVMIPPPGYAKGVRSIYAGHGVPALEGARPLPAGKKHALRRLPKKLKGFRAEAKAKAKSKASKQHAVIPHHQRFAEQIIPTTPPRWALASDGALILLDTGTEISKPAARSLIAFVRTLDAGAA